MGDLRYKLTVVQGDETVFEAGILIRPEDAETRIEIPTGVLIGSGKFCEIRLEKVELESGTPETEESSIDQ